MNQPSDVISDAALAPYNSFSLQARARYLYLLREPAQLTELFRWIYANDLPWLVLGSGSNVLLLEDFAGVVIINQLAGITLSETKSDYYLDVAAGEDWPSLVEWSVQQGILGLENLALIPGTVGAAPVQNIGAYGVELADVCQQVEFFSIAEQQQQCLSPAQCEFAYRDSIFKHALKDKALITRVKFRLTKQWQAKLNYGGLRELGEGASAQQIFQQVIGMRQQKLPDPKVLGNAGSFFKNPVLNQQQLQQLMVKVPAIPVYPASAGSSKVAAGWLIDRLGLKGFQHGGAGVHQQQALVLVNHGQATAADILSVCRHIRHQVWQNFALVLEPEVRFIGAHGEVNPDTVLGRPDASQ
ncbi:UDP-N-acetylmuramate dehydrogenase [Agarivorans gilvus]|uniref:UDP-N-acetylenolpyruvoylglucosamine reductase n=1 Tax=Agarivorans gilvus TaxID=680279 RepID=A0ABQ1I2T7_9ALTE|nr:UDP-N-acetylmuramate dehydrogenase [Agarivorans gilvus]GGB06878.1 UDP-N-acetylenolpyruvoylglucosamine reductase [Agarivorans gilvus]